MLKLKELTASICAPMSPFLGMLISGEAANVWLSAGIKLAGIIGTVASICGCSALTNSRSSTPPRHVRRLHRRLHAANRLRGASTQAEKVPWMKTPRANGR